MFFIHVQRSDIGLDEHDHVFSFHVFDVRAKLETVKMSISFRPCAYSSKRVFPIDSAVSEILRDIDKLQYSKGKLEAVANSCIGWETSRGGGFGVGQPEIWGQPDLSQYPDLHALIGLLVLHAARRVCLPWISDG